MAYFLNESIVDSDKGEDIGSKETWTAVDINRRTNILSDLIIKLYAF